MLDCISFEQDSKIDLKKIDPWKVSEIEDLDELQSELDFFYKFFEKWLSKKNSPRGLQLQKMMSIL